MKCSRTTRGTLAAIGLVAAWGLATPASADLIKVSYAGTLTDVAGAKLDDFFGSGNAPAVGAAFTGGFSFTWGTADSNPAANVALFTGGNSQFRVDFGGGRLFNQIAGYNQSEVGNDVTGPFQTHDIWTAYGQVGNSKGYEYSETGIVFLSFVLTALANDSFPTGSLGLSDFESATCGDNQADGISCAHDMEFHAKQDRAGDPYNIYGDVDIFGRITEIVIERVPGGTVPEPATLALLAGGLLALRWPRRARD